MINKSNILITQIRKWMGMVAKKPDVLYPMPEIHPESGYAEINDIRDDFKGLSTRASMGDTDAMMELFRILRKRLSDGYADFEKKCHGINDDEEIILRLNDYFNIHGEDRVNLLGSNMWLVRAAIYGSDEAEMLLKSSVLYRKSYLSREFQMPGAKANGYAKLHSNELRAIGLLDFTDDETYYIEPLNDKGFYVASYYVGYDGPDETGFGMEDYDNYFFFDEFFRLLFMIKEWSSRDIRNNKDRIDYACKNRIAEKNKERLRYWNQVAKAGNAKE